MSRNVFGKLCLLLQSQGGLRDTKHVSGCLGALDETYIDVRVPAEDRARYRIRKGFVSVNVLGVCDRKMRFIYVLAGWEGSAADGRVLRDAFTRPNGLKIPRDEGFGDEDTGKYLGTVDSNPIWNTWRDEMAKSMYNEWRGIP
ncbi:UNVERIFIED_CONTAM: hypothetical protein Slati_2366500 [Sesamum latifolium]|uniref:DDE Tnp4 domain-containing protein n=1 Tax=Sesamum latifolium TaxID=2727402 RepID=A0AAW2WAR9_9LAMI